MISMREKTIDTAHRTGGQPDCFWGSICNPCQHRVEGEKTYLSARCWRFCNDPITT
jgi:hypothetical protein